MCRSRTRVAIVLLLTASGCARASRSSLDDDARQYVRLGVALGERDPDSLDFYAGPADLVADLRRNPPPLVEIRRDAAALNARLSRETHADSAGADRARALRADLTALAARVDLLTGTRLPYEQESRVFFGLAPGPLDERRLSDVRSQIAEIVGDGGRLVDRYAAFAARFTIPGDRLPAVMSTAVDECRRRTVAHLTLPPDEQVRLEFVHNKPWSAYARYLGGAHSVLQINADFRFTVDQALQIACHEGYPGHHTRNVLRESAATVAARGPERWVQLTFSPSSLVSEASAMEAAGVAFSSAERVDVERDRLFPIAGPPAADVERHVTVERLVGDLQVIQADVARRYLDGELEFVRAVTALEDQALVPHAEAAVKYMNEYRSYVTTYTAGRAAFAARLAACAASRQGEDARWQCFKDESVR
jgi:hypothetical protein